MPLRIFVTDGATHDCTQAVKLIEGINAGGLIADKAYDAEYVLHAAREAGMQLVIPPRKHRKEQRHLDKQLYSLRHFVENTFLRLKEWRGIATRYVKNTASFLAALHVRCIAMWTKIY